MTSCRCVCHARGGSFISCDVGAVQPGGNRSCMVTHNSNEGARSDLCILEHGADRPQVEVGYLCGWHRNRMTRLTRSIEDYLDDLVFIREAGTAPKDDVPKTKKLKAAEAPAPADLTVLALLDARTHPVKLPAVKLWEQRWPYCDLAAADVSTPLAPVRAVIAGWALCLAEERPIHSALPQSVLGQLDLLERHHDWIAAQPWVDDYMREMGDIGKALKAALHDRSHKRIGWCPLPTETAPKCGGALLEENGTAVVRCVDCGSAWVTPRQQALLSLSLEAG